MKISDFNYRTDILNCISSDWEPFIIEKEIHAEIVSSRKSHFLVL